MLGNGLTMILEFLGQMQALTQVTPSKYFIAHRSNYFQIIINA